MHTQQFIEEMRQRLDGESEALKKQLSWTARRHDGDFQARMLDYGRSDEDNATEVADFTALDATTEAEEARLKEVEAAIKRIEEGTYGFTSDGEMIPEARLRANPAATTLVKSLKN